MCHRRLWISREINRWILRHIKSVHDVPEKNHCKECSFISKSKHSLNLHIRTIHKGLWFTCKHCKYVATSRRNLESHNNAKHEGISYACILCPFEAKTNSQIRHHQSKIHGIKMKEKEYEISAHQETRFTCKSCGYNFTTKGSLKRHVKLKTNDCQMF